MVSILLAAYNGEAWLPEQLASLQAQTLTDFRVLWRDDGSADGTAAVLEAAGRADPRFMPAADQGTHLGAIGSFLTLMAQDDAPYTALCDQDDVWHTDKLQRSLTVLQAAEAEYGADTPLLVHHDCRVVDAQGQELHASLFRHQGWDPAATQLRRLLVQNNVTGCTCLMNAALRRLVTENARADQLHMHDWFIALTAAAFGQIIFLDEALLDYRQHGSNAMGASRHGLLQRGLAALAAPERVRERLRLTYRHSEMFRNAYYAIIPDEAWHSCQVYEAIPRQSRRRRIRVLRRGGYLMQSRIARLGQYLFT